ncbi:unnamed protein product [Symbiodinium sp. CCMP2592]|nr:unnamed protein product [Symbiodinium sp. CCMP2592]
MQRITPVSDNGPLGLQLQNVFVVPAVLAKVGKQSDELRWQSSFAFSDLWTRNCTATLEDGKKGRGGPGEETHQLSHEVALECQPRRMRMLLACDSFSCATGLCQGLPVSRPGVAAAAQVGQSTASTMLPASEADTGAPAAAPHAGNASQSSQHPLEMKSRRSALWLPTANAAGMRCDGCTAAASEDMKSIIRQELENREAVEEANQDRFKDTGVFQCIARSNAFEHLTTSMIVIYSVWLAVDIDYNPRVVNTDTSSVFFWVEQFFCCFFVLEVSIRFLAFSSTWRWSRDFWFLFDLFLVMSMAIQVWLLPLLDSMLQSNHVGTIFADTGIIRVARLLRLSRLLRMSQLLHLFPEVLILVTPFKKAIAAALRSVVFTLALLLMILYVFAIAFTQLTRGTGCARQYFSSVPASMQTLFISGALLDDVGTLMNDLLAENLYISLTLMYTFVIMSAITVMNMLIGVMCEVISAVASAEKEAIQVQWLRKILERVAGGPDKRINQQKFFEILRDEGAANAMKGIGIDLISLVDFAELIFEESGDATDIDAEANETEISFDDFLKHVLQLRGSNTATVKDMVDLRWWLSQSLHLKLQATVEKTLEKGQLSQLQVEKAPLAG